MPEPRPKERAFVLRIPEHYAIALDEIVASSKGRIRSRNELIVEIIETALNELREKAADQVSQTG